jgi:hypothetical protein
VVLVNFENATYCSKEESVYGDIGSPVFFTGFKILLIIVKS